MSPWIIFVVHILKVHIFYMYIFTPIFFNIQEVYVISQIRNYFFYLGWRWVFMGMNACVWVQWYTITPKIGKLYVLDRELVQTAKIKDLHNYAQTHNHKLVLIGMRKKLQSSNETRKTQIVSPEQYLNMCKQKKNEPRQLQTRATSKSWFGQH